MPREDFGNEIPVIVKKIKIRLVIIPMTFIEALSKLKNILQPNKDVQKSPSISLSESKLSFTPHRYI